MCLEDGDSILFLKSFVLALCGILVDAQVKNEASSAGEDNCVAILWVLTLGVAGCALMLMKGGSNAEVPVNSFFCLLLLWSC